MGNAQGADVCCMALGNYNCYANNTRRGLFSNEYDLLADCVDDIPFYFGYYSFSYLSCIRKRSCIMGSTGVTGSCKWGGACINWSWRRAYSSACLNYHGKLGMETGSHYFCGACFDRCAVVEKSSCAGNFSKNNPYISWFIR